MHFTAIKTFAHGFPRDRVFVFFIMSNRLDILIFGATGYTGQYLVEEMARKAQQFGIKWGIAGRTKNKLNDVLQQASTVTGIADLSSNVDTVIANITDKKSLIEMCQRTKILIDCVGPYRLYGEPVVQACLEARTHYLDICGEPQFLETMQVRYDQEARDRQVAIIGSCGFDSLMADLGVECVRQDCEQKNLNITLIESFLLLRSGQVSGGLIHYATWESAVYGFSHANELKSLRRQLFPQRLTYPKFRLNRKPVFKTTVQGQPIWAVPFPGSDKSVVQRTQYFNATQLNQKPVRFQPYLQLPSFFSVLKLVFFGLIFSFFTKFKLGIQLLLKHPKLFSAGLVTHEGPSRAQCERSSFKMTFVTYTEEKQKLVYEFSGPDPGYLGTSTMSVACAIMLLREQDRLPIKGGVLTPGIAFARTSLKDYLEKNGITFAEK